MCEEIIDKTSAEKIEYHRTEAVRRMQLVRDCIKKVDNAERTTLANAIRAGMHLIAVKKLLPSGEWHQWLDTYFQNSKRTAREYIQLAEQRDTPLWEQIIQEKSIRRAMLLVRKQGRVEERSSSELMQDAMDARRRLEEESKLNLRSLPDEHVVFLYFGPGKEVWGELIKKRQESLDQELQARLADVYKGWYAEFQQQRADEEAAEQIAREKQRSEDRLFRIRELRKQIETNQKRLKHIPTEITPDMTKGAKPRVGALPFGSHPFDRWLTENDIQMWTEELEALQKELEKEAKQRPRPRERLNDKIA